MDTPTTPSIPGPPIPGPIERLGFWMRHIILTLSGRVTFTPLPPVLVYLVSKRFKRIKHRIQHIAALVHEGKYRPPVKRTTPPRPAAPGTRKPPQLDPRMRKFGWLGDIYPDMPPLRGSLRDLLQEPEMKSLIEAAPEAMLPPLRSLCWALGWQPPPILAQPRKPRTPKPKPAEAKEAPEPDWQPSLPGLPKLPGPRWPKGVKRWRNVKTA